RPTTRDSFYKQRCNKHQQHYGQQRHSFSCRCVQSKICTESGDPKEQAYPAGHIYHDIQQCCPKTGHEVHRARSEEHTSELQSRFDLVCRLLLEKKNNTTIKYL